MKFLTHLLKSKNNYGIIACTEETNSKIGGNENEGRKLSNFKHDKILHGSM